MLYDDRDVIGDEPVAWLLGSFDGLFASLFPELEFGVLGVAIAIYMGLLILRVAFGVKIWI